MNHTNKTLTGLLCFIAFCVAILVALGFLVKRKSDAEERAKEDLYRRLEAVEAKLKHVSP